MSIDESQPAVGQVYVAEKQLALALLEHVSDALTERAKQVLLDEINYGGEYFNVSAQVLEIAVHHKHSIPSHMIDLMFEFWNEDNMTDHLVAYMVEDTATLRALNLIS